MQYQIICGLGDHCLVEALALLLMRFQCLRYLNFSMLTGENRLRNGLAVSYRASANRDFGAVINVRPCRKPKARELDLLFSQTATKTLL